MDPQVEKALNEQIHAESQHGGHHLIAAERRGEQTHADEEGLNAQDPDVDGGDTSPVK